MNPDDLDLDETPEDRPVAGRPSWPAAMVVLVIAALAGAWLHAGLTDEVIAVAPRVSAWVGLDAVRLADTPVAVLHLTVTSHDDATVYLTSLTVDGAGLVGEQEQLWRPLTPGLVEDLRLPAELACRPGTTSAPLHLALTVTRTPTTPTGAARVTTPTADARTGPGTASPTPAVTSTPAATPPTPGGGTDTTTLTAVPGGVAGIPGGLCRAQEQQLPQAYANPTGTRVVSVSGSTLTLAVSGLPTAGADIFSVQADGWLLPLTPGTVSAVGGTATLTLGLPEPRCTDTGTRGVLPTGLQLVFTTPGTAGVREAYAPVGTTLARWLLAARNRLCPG